jgi:small subunit ribosomal protein S17
MPKRILVGTIVSDKTDKTVTVKVERKERHPLYGKIIRRSKKYHAHDEGNEFKPGDVVRIEETRPISKTKTWKVLDRVQAGKGQVVEADLEVEAVSASSNT